jgi:hypothetical protein
VCILEPSQNKIKKELRMDTKRYGQTVSEVDAGEMIRAREIVATILDFGVTQLQIVRIIKLLGMELVSREDMVSILDVVKRIESDDQKGKIIT